jgi:hypothetical protein
MVKKTKKILAGAVAAALCMSFSVQSFAIGNYVNSVGSTADDALEDITEDVYGSAVVGKDETQSQESEYTELEVSDEAIDAPVNVYATQAVGEDVYDPENPDADPETGYVDGTVMVVIPKTIVLDGKTGVGNYVVKVKGNIAADNVITVAPEDSVALKQDGKADVTATITQPIQRFAYKDTTALADAADLAKEVTVNYYTAPEATVEAKGLSAGSWAGTFDFTISFATV